MGIFLDSAVPLGIDQIVGGTKYNNILLSYSGLAWLFIAALLLQMLYDQCLFMHFFKKVMLE